MDIADIAIMEGERGNMSSPFCDAISKCIGAVREEEVGREGGVVAAEEVVVTAEVDEDVAEMGNVGGASSVTSENATDLMKMTTLLIVKINDDIVGCNEKLSVLRGEVCLLEEKEAALQKIKELFRPRKRRKISHVSRVSSASGASPSSGASGASRAPGASGASGASTAKTFD